MQPTSLTTEWDKKKCVGKRNSSELYLQIVAKWLQYNLKWTNERNNRNIFLLLLISHSIAVRLQSNITQSHKSISTVMVFVFCELIRCGGNLLELLSLFVCWNESRCKYPLISSFFPSFHPAVLTSVCGSRPCRCGVQRCGREDQCGQQQRHPSLWGHIG